MSETVTTSKSASHAGRDWNEIAIKAGLACSALIVVASMVGTVLYMAFYRKDTQALPWHYWIAPLLVPAIAAVLFGMLPFSYYFKVWRLKHKGR